MTREDLRRAAREAEAVGDYHEAHRLEAEADTLPPPALPVVNVDLASMRDADLETLAEAVMQEMTRRGRATEEATTP